LDDRGDFIRTDWEMWVSAMEDHTVACILPPKRCMQLKTQHSLKLSIKRYTTLQMKHQIKFHFLIGSIAQLNHERYITRLPKIQRLAHHGLYVKMLV